MSRHGALDGGADGLAAYRRIIPSLPHLFRPDAVAVLELGIGQARRCDGNCGESRDCRHNSARFGRHRAGHGAAIGGGDEKTVWHQAWAV